MKERLFDILSFVVLPVAVWYIAADDLRYLRRGAELQRFAAAEIRPADLSQDGRYAIDGRIDPRRIVAIADPERKDAIAALLFAVEGAPEDLFVLSSSPARIAATETLDGLLTLTRETRVEGRLRRARGGKLSLGARRAELEAALAKLGREDPDVWILEEGAPPPSPRSLALPGVAAILIGALALGRLRRARGGERPADPRS